MANERRAPILIVGASGRLGGVVARALLARGEALRALSCTPSKLSALQALGAEYMDTADLRLAMRETLNRFPMHLRTLESVIGNLHVRAH